MTRLPVLFFGIFLTLAASWMGLVLAGHLQFGALEPAAMSEGEIPQPQARSGLAQEGAFVYADLGCVYCHSQQTRGDDFGADVARGWGERQSVPRDYIFEPRVMLGTMRTGPDLMAVGQRKTTDWQHLHLFNPQITSEGSIMPPYRFLYDLKPIKGDEPAPDALRIPDSFPEDQAPEGYQWVPSPRAEALVAYLQSLRLDYDLPESSRPE
ncbi:MAG: cbb3-type cytochrome c oxidase subunit II [Opitutales bacterium]